MEDVYAEITEFISVTGDEVAGTSSTDHLKLKHKRRPIMSQKTDVTINVKGQCSANYQSVHFGVSITVKDIDIDTVPDYMNHLEELAFNRLHLMQESAEETLSDLVGKRQ